LSRRVFLACFRQPVISSRVTLILIVKEREEKIDALGLNPSSAKGPRSTRHFWFAEGGS
jgi:hypothetical protein